MRSESLQSPKPLSGLSGLHISTFLRQLTFDTLYAVEYVILLGFGFSSDVKDLIDQERRPIILSVILVLSFLALGLKLFYYLVMHVWSKVRIIGQRHISFFTLLFS